MHLTAYDLTCQVKAHASHKLLCCIATLSVSSQLDPHLADSARCTGLDAIFDWVAGGCWSYSIVVVCHQGRPARYEHAFTRKVIMLLCMPRMSMRAKSEHACCVQRVLCLYMQRVFLPGQIQ